MRANWIKKGIAVSLSIALVLCWWNGWGCSVDALWRSVIDHSGATVTEALVRTSWQESGARGEVLRRVGLEDGRWNGYSASVSGGGEEYVLVVRVPYEQLTQTRQALRVCLPGAAFACQARLEVRPDTPGDAMRQWLLAAGYAVDSHYAADHWESVSVFLAPGSREAVQLVKAGRESACWYVGTPCVFTPY